MWPGIIIRGSASSAPNAEVETVTSNSLPPDSAGHEIELVPLVRVIEEAAGDEPWALIGAASCRLQGADAPSPNLEFMTTARAVGSLAEMLDIDAVWERGAHLAAERLHFLREAIPVFVFAKPVFHGSYDTLSPMEIPSLWDALVQIEVGGISVLVTPLEWELLLAVILGAGARLGALREHLRDGSYDGRLLTRLLREGRVQPATEESVWAALEHDD